MKSIPGSGEAAPGMGGWWEVWPALMTWARLHFSPINRAGPALSDAECLLMTRAELGL